LDHVADRSPRGPGVGDLCEGHIGLTHDVGDHRRAIRTRLVQSEQVGLESFGRLRITSPGSDFIGRRARFDGMPLRLRASPST